MKGHVFKQCKCPAVRDQAGRRVNCPKPHGSWKWMADLPVTDGQPRRQQTKAGYKTKRDAEQGLREYLALADQGQVAPPALTTLGLYLEEWLDRVEPTLARTASSNYRIVLRSHVLPHLGTRRLTKLEPRGVALLYRHLLEQGGRGGRPLSATTVRTVHRVLHKALEDAVRDGALGRNPLARVQPPKAVKRELQVWDRDQVRKFLEVAAGDRLQAAWLLALLCGLRRGELAGLRWSDVDLEQGVLRVASQRTTDAHWVVVTKEPKGTSRRSIDLGPVLAEALQRHRAAAALAAHGGQLGLVFVREDGSPFHPDRLRELFQSLAKRAGVPVIRLHDARHSCATLALDAGLHPKVVQQLLGHSNWAVTMDLYSHRVGRLQREATQRLEELVHSPF